MPCLTPNKIMRILLVEDEVEIINFLKPHLEKEMFIVDTALDGERGAFLARSNDYDLIILDYILPKANGLEVLKLVRADKLNVPIIMLTVKSELTIKKELFQLGADDYLTKPFLFQELLLHIRAILRRPTQARGHILKIDNLVMDTLQQSLRRGNRTIYLTCKEFIILEYLMSHRGQVVTRGMILEHAWDINSDPFSNSLETHIASLRRKLNQSPGKELIHTFHGRGYKLDTHKM